MMPYLLNLFHDDLAANAEVIPGLEAQHSLIYIKSGSASIMDKLLQADSAVYCEDFALVKAGEEGAALWRWELVPVGDSIHLLKGNGVSSVLRMSRIIKMFELVPTSKWLFRLDSIYEFSGSTGMHSVPGSGIRCLLSGHMRVVSDKGECSDNSHPGDCWYEEGAYPLVSTVVGDVKTTFVRCLVMPPEYANKHIAVWLDGLPATPSKWKKYVEKIITLR